MKKERIDILLKEKGLVESREKARSLIIARKVKVNGNYVLKPGDKVEIDSFIEIEAGPKYVSRGGLKLEEALINFNIDVKGVDCLDIGASTGGFTDCLLQFGANRVIALDVGKNQLHEKLKNDKRVFVIEGYNARYLKRDDLPFLPELVVIDVSFISIKLILSALKREVPKARVVALIKPQFEAGKNRIAKGGIVKDEKVKEEVLDEIKSFAHSLGYKIKGEIKSPIKGTKGNEEFLIYLI